MAVDLAPLLADLQAETDDLLGILADPAVSMDAPTPAVPWTVADTVGHLWFFDRENRLALTEPDVFNAGLEVLFADVEGYLNQHLQLARDLGDQLLSAFADERAGLMKALGEADPAARMPWYGPPMSPATAATARLMETWAHGQDIADGLGVKRIATTRLRHICFLGVRTRDFSYAVRGLTPSTSPVYLALTPPDSSTDEIWTWGSPDSADSITGPALDFCLLITQRRLVSDLSLTIIGDAAREWMSIAQAFAGMPTLTDATRSGLPAR